MRKNGKKWGKKEFKSRKLIKKNINIKPFTAISGHIQLFSVISRDFQQCSEIFNSIQFMQIVLSDASKLLTKFSLQTHVSKDFSDNDQHKLSNSLGGMNNLLNTAHVCPSFLHCMTGRLAVEIATISVSFSQAPN